MRIDTDVSLDPTLGCGQAHRWMKDGGAWTGVIGKDVVTVRRTDTGFEFEGTSAAVMERYFRTEDDLPAIYAEIASRDPYMAELAHVCPGLRILRQPAWECIGTYLLATNANVKRIGAMVGSVCREFGDDLGGGWHAFPTPGQILDGRDRVSGCRLGYREDRLISLAESAESGSLDPEGLADLGYEECVGELLKINGIGPKVADCVALFAYGHQQAFPVDARIGNVLRERYGQEGCYKKLSSFGRERFGRYAGYAQELLYHCGTMVS